jgi:hypothetical protein
MPTSPSWRFTNKPSRLGKHTMKNMIVGGLAAAGIALGIAAAVPAQAHADATTKDATFVAGVRAGGVTGSVSRLIANGHTSATTSMWRACVRRTCGTSSGGRPTWTRTTRSGSRSWRSTTTARGTRT